MKLLLTLEQIDLFRNGDDTVLDVIYQHYSSQLVFVAYKYLQHTDEAKDVAMEVFDKLLRMDAERRQKIPSDAEAFGHWLFLVTKNYCLDVIRHNKVMQKREQDGSDGDLFFVHSEAEQKWDEETVTALLNRLPAAERRVFRMHYEGFSNEEISKALSVSYNTVRNQLSSGKKKIRRYISGGQIVLLFLILL